MVCDDAKEDIVGINSLQHQQNSIGYTHVIPKVGFDDLVCGSTIFVFNRW